MKTKLLLLFILLLSTATYAQKDTVYFSYSDTNKTSIANGYVPFLVGSATIPGYTLETRMCLNDESIVLPNGRRIAGLSCILQEKYDYIGGKLIFGKDTTIITDINIVPDGTGALFSVNGAKFSMGFNLINGIILAMEDTHIVFNTEGRGIWSIVKKA